MIDYNLIRSKRKTLAIHIKKDASVEVRAPLKTPKRVIDKFILQKSDWINKNIKKIKEILEKQQSFSFNEQTKLLYLGKEYPIKNNKAVCFDGEFFYLPFDNFDKSKRTLILLYKELAKYIINERVKYYSNLMCVEPSSVKINSAMKRWGSCSGKNSLNFSFMLIMADIDAIDYVVVHELAHIIEHNHSIKFWNLVENTLPDYKARENSLKNLQNVILQQNWK